MAVSNAVGALYAARLDFNFKRQSVWRQVVEDHTSEVNMGGNALVLNRDATDYDAAVQDYTAGTNLQAPTRIDTGAATLELNKQKAISVYVDDIETAEVRPSLINSSTFEIARALALQVNDDIRAAATAAPALPSTHVLDKVVAGANFANLHTKAVRDEYLDRHWDASEVADELGWPRQGRVVVMAPAVYRSLGQSFFEAGVTFSGNTNDMAVLQAMVDRFAGWMPVVDAGIPKTGNDAYRLYFCLAGNGISYAQQRDRMESIRDTLKFGDNLRWLMKYGAVRNAGNYVLTAQTAVA